MARKQDFQRSWKRTLIATLAVAAAQALGATPGWARGELVPGSRYVSGRAAALGDAFVPLANDGASGLFYNPAGLGHIRRGHAEPLNIAIQGNQHYFASPSLKSIKITSLGGYEDQLQANPGENHSASFSAVPVFFMRGLAFGVLAQTRFFASEENGQVRYRSKYQFIPTLGGALRMASGVVRIGYSLQWVNQASGDLTVPASSTLGHNRGLLEGSGISHNVGLTLTVPRKFLPSFSLVGRNLFGLRYRQWTLVPLAKNSGGVLPDEPMTFDAAVGISPRIGNGAFMNLVLQLRDFTNRSGVALWGRLAAGMELSFRDQFFLRGGWGSGYPSAGIGLRSKTAEVSIGWFSEEVGTRYRDERDTRYILQYKFRPF